MMRNTIEEAGVAFLPRRRKQVDPIDGRDLVLNKPFYGQVRITVETAVRWADLNIGNRRFRRSLRDDLARMILSGEWQRDHPQPIVFTSEGRLMDGQHRVHAIIKAGQTVVATVLCGARPELRAYLDMGISRTLDDRICFSDDDQENRRIASIVSAFAQLANPGSRVTPQDAREIFGLHRVGILFAETINSAKQRGVCVAYVMVGLAELHERDPDLAEKFGRSLLRPDGEVQAARVLRDCLLRISQFRGTGGGQKISIEKYERTVYCAKAALEDKPIAVARRARW
jgi:hypothetical protein